MVTEYGLFQDENRMKKFIDCLIFNSGPDDCTFENGLCGFANVDGDDFDWTQRMGKTPSSRTGPEVDHTTLRFGEFTILQLFQINVIGPKYKATSQDRKVTWNFFMNKLITTSFASPR